MGKIVQGYKFDGEACVVSCNLCLLGEGKRDAYLEKIVQHPIEVLDFITKDGKRNTVEEIRVGNLLKKKGRATTKTSMRVKASMYSHGAFGTSAVRPSVSSFRYLYRKEERESYDPIAVMYEPTRHIFTSHSKAVSFFAEQYNNTKIKRMERENFLGRELAFGK